MISVPLFLGYRHPKVLPREKQFTLRRASSCTRRRSIRLAPIVEYSRLLPPVGVWPVLNAIVGGQALTSPTRHCLGKPLPYQQADRPQTTPIPESIARNLYLTRSEDYRELANLSAGYARA